jgi:4-hydroxy-tetrahydrodipicolinate synthase
MTAMTTTLSDTLRVAGSGVALVTLFDQDGHLLTQATAELAAAIVEAGAASVLVSGTVGEFYTLEDHERVELFAAVRLAVPTDVPVIAHVGGVPADRAVALARAGTDAGADVLIALPLAVEDVRAYYAQIVRAAAGTPVFGYHLPQIGGVIDLSDLRHLELAGLKDSSADSDRFAHEVFELDYPIFTGNSTLLGLAHDLQAGGSLTADANIYPERCAAALEGDSEAQRDIAQSVLRTGANFPGGFKQAAAERWGVPAFTRATPANGFTD